MSPTLATEPASLRFDLGSRFSGALRRVPTAVWGLAILALALVAVFRLHHVLEAPGQLIRDQLEDAAAELGQPALAPSEALRQAIVRHFDRQRVLVDMTSHWPNVSVTLRNLDRDTCIDASVAARRIEGAVLIRLDGYRAETDCVRENDMTWRIMP
jgi:hypothetical protein